MLITQAQIQDVVDKIVQGYQPEKIILFGSYAYGTPTEDSDLDLLIIKDDSALKKRQRKQELEKLFWGLNFSIDAQVYTNEEFKSEKDISNCFFEEIIKTGKTMYEKRA